MKQTTEERKKICNLDKNFNLEKDFLEKYSSKEPDMTDVGYTVYKRTYARSMGNGETEEWWQTVKRVVEGVYTIRKRHAEIQGNDWNAEAMRNEAQEMYEKIFSFKFTPPGRGLWMMGSDYIFERETSAPLFNCAFVTTKKIDENFTQPFEYMMDMSMLGVGVGFDTKGKNQIKIKKPEVDENWTFTVPDSREGWVESLGILLEGYGNGEKIPAEFDYSKIRDEGEPLKGFGGTSSGPQPLRDLHENIRKLLNPLIGEEIDTPAIVDLMNLIGKCVVAGNIRRSAQICVGNKNNEDYLSLKDPDEQTDFWGEPENQHHRWAANLSIHAKKGMDYGEAAERTAKNGEPGYVWIKNARNNARMGKNDMPEDEDVLGTNPCVTGDTLVSTSNGLERIEELAGQDNIDIRVDSRFGADTEQTALQAYKTGEKPVYTVKTSDGFSLEATEDHRIMTDNGWKQVKDLETGENIHILDNKNSFDKGGNLEKGKLLGWLVGDGTLTNKTAKLYFYEEDRELSEDFAEYANNTVRDAEGARDYEIGVVNRSTERNNVETVSSSRLREIAGAHGLTDEKLQVPEQLFTGKEETVKGFLQGLFSADGSVQGTPENGSSVRLSSISKDMLQDVQMLLLNLGIYSKIYENRKTAGKKELPDGHGGTKEYDCKALHELLITKKDMKKFQDKIGFLRSDKQEQLKELLESYTKGPYRNKRKTPIESIELEEVKPVYDLTEPETESFIANGLVVHNCAEVVLAHGEKCNLSETYPSNHNNLEDWKETLKFAYIYAKTVTLLPNHSPLTDKQIKEKRRLGVSMSGIVQAFNKFGKRQMLDAMDEGYRELQDLDGYYSQKWNVPESIRLTSVKPSGTVSRLADVTSGIHFPESKYYTRNIRFNENSEVLDQLEEANYPTEEALNSDNTKVVSFPMKKDNIRRGKKQVSMWEQLENAAQVAENWADNAVSITVTYDPETEADHIEDALELYEDRLKTVSFLPQQQDVYDQAPYIPISKEEYEENKAEVDALDLSGDTNEKIEKYCQGDKCEIDLSSGENEEE